MLIYSYRNNWERAKLRVKLDNDWRDTVPYVYVNGAWKKAFRPVPPGLIIPYYGTTAPAGWSLFTEANGKFIVGAGGAYAVKSTGGTSSITTANSTSGGVHSGLSFGTGGGWSGADNKGLNSAGSHSHLISFNYTPPYYSLTLIKANTELNRLPSKSIIFSDRTFPSLSRFTNGDGKLFMAQNVINGGGSNSIPAQTSTSAGVHVHGNSTNVGKVGEYWKAIPSGEHTHFSTAFTITPNLRRVLLSAWTDISNNFALEPGMYAFYESLTPPDGWVLCDGNNGTLDLRDYFIEFSNENNHGTKTGDGTISIPSIALANNTWEHSHRGERAYEYYGSTYHALYNAPHGHTIPASSQTFLPPYYALSIITLKS